MSVWLSAMSWRRLWSVRREKKVFASFFVHSVNWKLNSVNGSLCKKIIKLVLYIFCICCVHVNFWQNAVTLARALWSNIESASIVYSEYKKYDIPRNLHSHCYKSANKRLCLFNKVCTHFVVFSVPSSGCGSLETPPEVERFWQNNCSSAQKQVTQIWSTKIV